MAEQFYVVAQPGLEEELQKEILEVWPYLLDADSRPNSTPVIFLSQEIGGWLIEAPLILGLQLNFFSRMASRVLLRLDEFKVRDFAKLIDRLRKIPVDSFFSKVDFRVEVAASKSRLNNEKKIYELAKQVWPKIKEDAEAALMIRMFDDICTISVDTTGSHLHRRAAIEDLKWIGDAPLRETLAAFAVKKLVGEVSVGNLQEVVLWDPMAGSGTLLKEAQQRHQGNFSRHFSFQDFALTPKLLKSQVLEKNFPEFQSGFCEYWAGEKDEKMLPVLQRNLASIEAKKISLKDIFTEKEVLVPPGKQLWLISNPPYGQRLPFLEGFLKLGETFGKFPVSRIGLVLPKGALSDFLRGLQKNKNWTLQSQSFFKNGGIPVEFSVFYGDPSSEK